MLYATVLKAGVLASLVSAGTVLWDGRFNDLSSSKDLNNCAFHGLMYLEDDEFNIYNQGHGQTKLDRTSITYMAKATSANTSISMQASKIRRTRHLNTASRSPSTARPNGTATCGEQS
jgi:hypothetical protein